MRLYVPGNFGPYRTKVICVSEFRCHSFSSFTIPTLVSQNDDHPVKSLIKNNRARQGDKNLEILITGGAFVGAILGRYFAFPALVPVGALAVALLIVKCQLSGIGAGDSALFMMLLITSLEFGYVTGLISTDLTAEGPSSGFRGTGRRRAAPSREGPKG